MTIRCNSPGTYIPSNTNYCKIHDDYIQSLFPHATRAKHLYEQRSHLGVYGLP